MAGLSDTHERLRTVATVVLGVGVVLCVIALGFGLYAWIAHAQTAVGMALLLGGMVWLLLAILAYGQLQLLIRLTNYAYRAYDALLEMGASLRRQEEHVHTVAENSHLSDWAKRIVYREKDFEFLRETINGAIVRQDWEAAEHLISDVDTEFGYHDAAEGYRAQLEQARQATADERIATALSRFDQLCEQQKWDMARRDSERLHGLFPSDARIAALPQEIELRRQEYKRKLLAEYDQAIRTQNMEQAHQLLFALDQYLLPKEAEPLKASARGVFRAKLEQLRTQFSIAVSDKQFATAIDAGDRLVREFPNSGYAQEIHKLLPVLRARAAEQQSAHAASAAS